MREITSHKMTGGPDAPRALNEVNAAIDITAMDEPGPGGASFHYVLDVPSGIPEGRSVEMRFQNGAIKEVGVNGITHEALLAVVIDRLQGFQQGPYACDENQQALTALYKARDALNRRTELRQARGVEGTMAI